MVGCFGTIFFLVVIRGKPKNSLPCTSESCAGGGWDDGQRGNGEPEARVRRTSGSGTGLKVPHTTECGIKKQMWAGSTAKQHVGYGYTHGGVVLELHRPSMFHGAARKPAMHNSATPTMHTMHTPSPPAAAAAVLLRWKGQRRAHPL